MCKFESLQKDKSRAQSDDSTKAYRKPRAFIYFQGESHHHEVCLWKVFMELDKCFMSSRLQNRLISAKISKASRWSWCKEESVSSIKNRFAISKIWVYSFFMYCFNIYQKPSKGLVLCCFRNLSNAFSSNQLDCLSCSVQDFAICWTGMFIQMWNRLQLNWKG